MWPSEADPARGRFVADQVAALRVLPGVEVEVFHFPPGMPNYVRGALALRRAHRGDHFDIVHAHFGLTAWPALALPARVRALTVHGSDLSHPRTRLATAAVLAKIDVLGAVSQSLIARLPGRAARERALVLPCGVDLARFQPIERAEARAQLGLERAAPYVLFAADPARPEKRHDLARALADAAGARLLTFGGVDPRQAPLWFNAANAVLVPSEREGFGLATLEALACDVPVLATPVGVHAEALAGVAGTLCAPFELSIWLAALAPHLQEQAPRPQGRAAAERFSSVAMAQRVREAWERALEHSDERSG
jgi:teichuronic acid biosynthesis glycosyltransferase TuaC